MHACVHRRLRSTAVPELACHCPAPAQSSSMQQCQTRSGTARHACAHAHVVGRSNTNAPMRADTPGGTRTPPRATHDRRERRRLRPDVVRRKRDRPECSYPPRTRWAPPHTLTDSTTAGSTLFNIRTHHASSKQSITHQPRSAPHLLRGTGTQSSTTPGTASRLPRGRNASTRPCGGAYSGAGLYRHAPSPIAREHAVCARPHHPVNASTDQPSHVLGV